MQVKAHDDVHVQVCGVLIDQGAESALTKLTALMLGGRIAPIVGGILTLLVPSDVAQTYVWKSTTRDGAAVTFVVTGFNL